jgi:hypothetical protein
MKKYPNHSKIQKKIEDFINLILRAYRVCPVVSTARLHSARFSLAKEKSSRFALGNMRWIRFLPSASSFGTEGQESNLFSPHVDLQGTTLI